MSQDVFKATTLNDIKKMIIDYISEHGSGRWVDFERKLGIPRSTLSKALNELMSEGKIIKEKRGMYVLAKSKYADLIQDYAQRFCKLIGCVDTNLLTKDLMNIIGEDFIVVEESHRRFMINMMNYMKKIESEVDPLVKSVIELYLTFLTDKAFYTLIMCESVKLAKGLAILDECDVLTLGLPENIASKLKEYIHTARNVLTEYYNLNERVVEVLEKVRVILEKHGYIGEAKTKIMTKVLKLNMRDHVEMAFMILLKFFGYLDEGCRSLSTKEKEELLR
jgi:DNA-binding Lrp family transcriptional regulator